MQIDTVLPLCPEDEKLQMRKWVINSVLESEKTYLGMLDILMQVRHFAGWCLLFCTYYSRVNITTRLQLNR